MILRVTWLHVRGNGGAMGCSDQNLWSPVAFTSRCFLDFLDCGNRLLFMSELYTLHAFYCMWIIPWKVCWTKHLQELKFDTTSMADALFSKLYSHILSPSFFYFSQIVCNSLDIKKCTSLWIYMLRHMCVGGLELTIDVFLNCSLLYLLSQGLLWTQGLPLC